MSASQSPEHLPAGWLQNLRVTTKIYIGVAVLLVLFLSSLGISYLGLNRAASATNRLADASSTTRQIGDIDRNIVSLQQKVSIYALSGNQAAVIRINELGSKLQEAIADAIRSAADEDALYRLQQMKSHLRTYLENFETVVDERELRRELVDDAILAESSDIERLLREVIDARNGTARETAAKALAETTIAKNRALRYLSNPGSRLAAEGLAALGRARQILQDAVDDAPDQFTVAEEAAVRFENGFLRMLQATRGYLYLVNVVMAGEAAEFSYQSDQLKELSSQQLADVTHEVLEETWYYRNLAIFLTSVSILLGAVAAWRLVRNIVEPISEITDTFRRFLRHEPVDAIPGLHRGDEIGEMARAAELLKEKSIETVTLLTQTEQLAEALEAKASQLEKSNEDLDSFAYVASHDLKSPLRAIDNVAHWIAEDAGDILPEQSREHLQILRARVRRMEILLDDLLAYSRAGRVGSQVSRVEVAELLREIKDTIEWPDDMELRLANQLPVIHTDATALQRVFMNLLTNAVKYRVAESPRVDVSSREVTTPNGDMIEFAVSDNGIGIEEKYHHLVFQMFKRLHHHNEIDGTGMGLALIDKLVKSHGGTITLESALDAGATFRFTWPSAMAATTAELAPA